MSEYHNNSIFWVETEKINPNPFQPRREFDTGALEDLADSIRQYGVLQPLVVTRKETLRPDNDGMDVFYELIAGERRLRASKIAGLHQVPVIIRKETDDKIKLELAIIENLQREDLNPIDRALAFEQLHKEFGLTHVEIGKRMGKSRVYVSNSMRLLALPQEIQEGLKDGRITEGHTRPLLMLSDRPEEQNTLYREIMAKRMSVRDAEKVARNIAQDRVRKREFIIDPKIRKYEQELSENLGTRVQIEPKENGGQITIEYFTLKDLDKIFVSLKKKYEQSEGVSGVVDITDNHTQTFQKKGIPDTDSEYQRNSITHATGLQFADEDIHKANDSSHQTEGPLYYRYRKKNIGTEKELSSELPLYTEDNKNYDDTLVDVHQPNYHHVHDITREQQGQLPMLEPEQQSTNEYHYHDDKMSYSQYGNNPHHYHTQQNYHQPYQPAPRKKSFFEKLFG